MYTYKRVVEKVLSVTQKEEHSWTLLLLQLVNTWKLEKLIQISVFISVQIRLIQSLEVGD